jgi:hypothetical protein
MGAYTSTNQPKIIVKLYSLLIFARILLNNLAFYSISN